MCKAKEGTFPYPGFDVALEPPVDLQAIIQYSLDASISGPPSWYGQGGLPCVKHAGVTFFFANTAGANEWQDATVSQKRFAVK